MKRIVVFALVLNAALLGVIAHQLVAIAGGGPEATENGDTNGDGARDISDAVHLLQWLFSGGEPPVAIAQEGGNDEDVAQLRAMVNNMFRDIEELRENSISEEQVLQILSTNGYVQTGDLVSALGRYPLREEFHPMAFEGAPDHTEEIVELQEQQAVLRSDVDENSADLQGDILGEIAILQGQQAVLRSDVAANAAEIADAGILNAEQAEILGHMSIEQLPVDDNGNTAKAIRFSGVNVQVVNGTNSTRSERNGLGNLIVGYQELRVDDGNVDRDQTNNRSGSHNLVVGSANNYSIWGGQVVGYHNSISGPLSTVAGGQYNTASGEKSTVGGGNHNTASGQLSTVGGGQNNFATNTCTTVSGGCQNTASGGASTVSGGQWNVTAGMVSTVSGGYENNAAGDYSTVSGGSENTALGRTHLP
jgi:hypothetical protein